VNSIRGSGSLLRNPVVTKPVGMQGQESAGTKASVKPTPTVSTHSIRSGGLRYGKKGSKREIAAERYREPFIENGRTVKTIGRLAIAVMTRVPLEC
jgi:hypothetical protein